MEFEISSVRRKRGGLDPSPDRGTAELSRAESDARPVAPVLCEGECTNGRGTDDLVCSPPVLELAAGLSSRALQAIAELEQRVIETNGGRLKLEWGTLRRRRGDRVADLLWWEGDRDRLLGFLGTYGFESSPELAGMVAPDARRRGIGTALLDAALPLCRERGDRQPLLIVPRPSVAGKRLALRRGGVLDHSEPRAAEPCLGRGGAFAARQNALRTRGFSSTAARRDPPFAKPAAGSSGGTGRTRYLRDVGSALFRGWRPAACHSRTGEIALQALSRP